jgi:hypothetical protein
LKKIRSQPVVEAADSRMHAKTGDGIKVQRRRVLNKDKITSQSSIIPQKQNNSEHFTAMAIQPVTVTPIAAPAGSAIDFGATIEGVDIENLSGKSTWK